MNQNPVRTPPSRGNGIGMSDLPLSCWLILIKVAMPHGGGSVSPLLNWIIAGRLAQHFTNWCESVITLDVANLARAHW